MPLEGAAGLRCLGMESHKGHLVRYSGMVRLSMREPTGITQPTNVLPALTGIVLFHVFCHHSVGVVDGNEGPHRMTNPGNPRPGNPMSVPIEELGNHRFFISEDTCQPSSHRQ